MIISATQIKITNIIGFFRFIFRVTKIKTQLKNTQGLELIKFNGFRTLSGWKDIDSMKKFRNNSHHSGAMKNIKLMGKKKALVRNQLPNLIGMKQLKNKIKLNFKILDILNQMSN